MYPIPTHEHTNSQPQFVTRYEDFAIDFPLYCPPEYYQLLASIEANKTWQVETTANAIRGFHFSDSSSFVDVEPNNDTLLYFPRKPNPTQLHDLADKAAHAPGWGGRAWTGNNSYRGKKRAAYCYEITPDDHTSLQEVIVNFNAYYGSRDGYLMGLRVPLEKIINGR